MIIVTGMHRSGTSVTAQILAEIGMDMGDHNDLLAADQWNAQGYWENLRVLDCNDRLVLGGGSFYPTHYYHQPRNQRTLGMRSRMNYLWARFILRPSLSAIEKRAHYLDQEIQSITTAFQGVVVKDPRFSLTLPVWQKHQTVERVLIMIRRPDEVADSLLRRNHMPRRYGLSLWRLHYHVLLNALDGVPTVFVDFNNMLQQQSCDAEIARICSFSEKPVDAATRQLLQEEIINPSLATEVKSLIGVDSETEQLYRRLQMLHAAYDRPLPFQSADMQQEPENVHEK